MVTTGAMGAIDAICHLFAGRGERIAVESPCYANILQLMREAGARLVPVAMAEGLGRLGPGPLAAGAAGRGAPDRLRRRRLPQPHRRARRRGPAARPGGRGPLGGDGARRRRDDDRAAPGRRDVDDAAPGVRASTRRARTVITVGSASKAFWAGMRIGWVRAAPDVIRSLVAARAYADLGTPGARAARRELAAQHGRLGAGGRARGAPRPGRTATRWSRRCAGSCPTGSSRCRSGGLTLWVRTGGLSGSRLAEAGERVGVRVPSGPRFGVDGAFEGYVRLPFTVGGRGGGRGGGPAGRRGAAGGERARRGGGRSRRGPSWPDGTAASAARPLRRGTGRASAQRRGRDAVHGAPRSGCHGGRRLLQRPRAGSVRRRPASGQQRSTACRCASLVASSYGSGVAGTWSRWTGPAPSRA